LSDPNWAALSNIIRMLGVISGPIVRGHVLISLKDILSAGAELNLLQQIHTAQSLFLEFDTACEQPKHFSVCLYHISITLSDWVFYQLIQRPVQEDKKDGKRRCLTCGPAIPLEFYALQNATADQREMLHRDYERHLEKLKKNGQVLGLGNLKSLMQQSA